MARSLAEWRGGEPVTRDDLQAAARLQSQPRLSDVAQRIEARYRWDDIVLPEERVAQLREIALQVRYQHVVYEQWGFAPKASLGRGVSALFVGESGTGKTMAAEVIAAELGLDLYKIDLSGLVSKYIGETEKNLSRVFDEASGANAILFFDEADAVFGKRTEVRDSHDRYANIEVSYLLQKIEEYDGIVVLASNLRANLDEAFLRRLKAIIDFPFPEEADRRRIWELNLRSRAPLADDVDLEFAARQFRLAGGNIRNIALLGAFLAASEGGPIAMRHVVRAARREFQKLGRLVTQADFAHWYAEAAR
jgi:SpoVK/Ycf46/Vps4 family AAA+-type ATPase